jgi:hypothetical protein
MYRKAFIGLWLTGLFILACEPPERVSPIPEISFKSFTLDEYIDSLDNRVKAGVLTFGFIDGDADIGSFVLNSDTNEARLAEKYNLFLIPFEKRPDGYYDSVKTDPLKYIIRHNEKLDRIGQNKTIKGEIEVNIIYAVIPDYDTLRYEFYLLDRARHRSNIEYTTDIGFR